MTMERIQISKEEQETTIVISPYTKTAKMYSCVPSMIKKIEGITDDQDVKTLRNDRYGIMVEVPMRWIKIAKPQKRAYTEEQRNALRERLEKARTCK